jgi:hypothetical protein
VNSNAPSVITLRGTDYVTFRYLKVQALSSTWADCIEFRHSASHNTVSHCHLDAYAFGSSGVQFKSLNFGGVNEYLTLEHSYIVNGQHGVYIYNGGPRIHGIRIEGNQFVNQRYNGMDISILQDLIIRNNHFSTTSNYI